MIFYKQSWNNYPSR